MVQLHNLIIILCIDYTFLEGGSLSVAVKLASQAVPLCWYAM